ncbi:MAG: metal-dependent transcriptional regulator [Methanomassiliicoccales archaeon]
MVKLELSAVEARYLKEALRIAETGGSFSVSALSRRLSVSMPSVIGVLKRLENKGLIHRNPWKPPELTKEGRMAAEQFIHAHRVIEVFYHSFLGLEAGTACREASAIDYVVSEEVVGRLCTTVKRPDKCFHGLPIEHSKSDNRINLSGGKYN